MRYFQWTSVELVCKVCDDFQVQNSEDLKSHYSEEHSVFELLENGVEAWQVFYEDDEHFMGLISKWLL